MNWWKLRSVGNLYVLKVSYVILIVSPLLTKSEHITRFLDIEPWLLAILFLASFSLALANLVYDIWCPIIIKRFPSPNDLYARMLEIKKLALWIYPDDDFKASLNHCKSAYETQSKSRWAARLACTLLFLISGAAFLVVFSYRGYVVFKWLFSAES